MTPYYHKTIRRLVVAFGDIFNDITLIRYNPDNTEQQRIKVPIAYAPKEKYLMQLQSDPNLTKKTQIVLPRMSFELTGVEYDSSRKQNTMGKTFAASGNQLISVYNPVPYNFSFTLSFYVRSIEDGTQILEQILPYFTPDYTIKVNLVPEMNLVKEIPVLLESADYEVEYQGPADNETRTVIWTLTFTAKGYLFGPTSKSGSGYITSAITNILNDSTVGAQNVLFSLSTGYGSYKEGELVYQGFFLESASARGKVVSWNPTTRQLIVNQITGNFVVNGLIIGLESQAEYNLLNYQITPAVDVKITITPNPTNANVSNAIGVITTINEFPYTN
jgi:hypothetical protein